GSPSRSTSQQPSPCAVHVSSRTGSETFASVCRAVDTTVAQTPAISSSAQPGRGVLTSTAVRETPNSTPSSPNTTPLITDVPASIARTDISQHSPTWKTTD